MRVEPKYNDPVRINFQIERETLKRFKQDAQNEGFKTLTDYLNKIIAIVLGDEN